MHAGEEGGLSGEPLFPKTLRVVQQLYRVLQEEIPIVAVGGILSPENALQLSEEGAKLIQIYTGLIYQGPSLLTDILDKLAHRNSLHA